MNVDLTVTSTFWAAAEKLPASQKTKLFSFLHRYPKNPRSSGFNFEKITLTGSDKMRSIRLDQKYRIIAYQEKANNKIICLHVDVHDAAYVWARTHRFEKNQYTGVYQTIQISESSEITPKEESKVPRLFSRYRDRELLRLGVPEEQLDLVQGFKTIHDLEEHSNVLPEEAWLALYDLAAGESYEDILREITELAHKYDDQNELDHPENKRQFVTIADEDLQKMIDSPLSEWRIYLHPSQERIVKMQANGPIRVLGGAGTGKTVVAMHRAHYLASEIFTKEEDRILFLVFNSNLAADISANLKRMCAPDVFERINVDNVDSWVRIQAKKHGLPDTMSYFDHERGLVDQAWRMAWDEVEDLPYSYHFIRTEFEVVVAAGGLQSLHQYLRASRRGRGQGLTRTARSKLWKVFEAYRDELKRQNITDPCDLKYQLADIFQTSPPGYCSVVVDEAQDMSQASLRMIRAILPEGPNDLLLAGDTHQRIYGRKEILSHCNINIRGRGRRLRINYRTPERVRNWAIGFLRGIPYDDMDGQLDSMRGYTSLIQGEKPPVVKHYGTQVEEQEGIIDYINSLECDKEHLHHICLVAPVTRELDRYVGALTARGIKVHRLKKTNDNPSIPGVRLATMHRVKGLEYDHMIVASANKNYLPFQSALKAAGDNVEEKEVYQKARSLLYVACTRARKTLLISSYGKQSTLVEDVVQKKVR